MDKIKQTIVIRINSAQPLSDFDKLLKEALDYNPN